MSKTRFTFELSELSGDEEKRVRIVHEMFACAGLGVSFTSETVARPSVEPSVCVDVSLTADHVPVAVVDQPFKSSELIPGRRATVVIRVAGVPVATGRDVAQRDAMAGQVRRAAADAIQQLRYIHDAALEEMIQMGVL